MKRHNSHLPNLNSLFLQNRLYQKHKQCLQKSRSQYEQLNNVSRVSGSNRQVVKYRLNSEGSQSSDKLMGVSMLSNPDSFQAAEPEKITQRVLKPFEKRKMSERNQENIRMLLALQSSNPSQYRYDHQGEQARQILKNRISKFAKEGSTVRYKFKKSLAEIQRRKLHKMQTKEKRVIVPEEVRLKLQALQRKNQSNQKSKAGKSKQTSCSDIYTYNFVEPVKNRSACPSDQQLSKQKKDRPRKMKTEPQGNSSIEENQTFANKYQALKQSLQMRQKHNKVAALIGQSSTVVLKHQFVKLPPSDMEIVTLPPITFRQ